MNPAQSVETTPLAVIAQVSRVVTRVVDRLTGDRSDYPLLVAMACQAALKHCGVESRVMYGQAAWIEVLEDHSVIWTGCWGEHFSFWVETEFAEVVDLNVSVGHRKRSHSQPEIKGVYSPPLLWSQEIPKFYRYRAEGIAELELTDEKDQKRFDLVLREIQDHCRVPGSSEVNEAELEFPNEAILCPGRRLLDDSQQSFRHFDRALSVHGIPTAPF